MLPAGLARSWLPPLPPTTIVVFVSLPLEPEYYSGLLWLVQVKVLPIDLSIVFPNYLPTTFLVTFPPFAWLCPLRSAAQSKCGVG